METRNAKIIISSVGGTASSCAKTYKISLPSVWINSLEINENNREVELLFDGEKIVIAPKISFENFMLSAKKKGHKLLKINYYNGSDLCTTIAADYSDKIIKFNNFTDNYLYTAFGIKENVNWDDYNSFLEDRCVPKSRMGIREYLFSIGLDEYSPIEIIKKTHGKMAEDNQWLEVEEI